MKRKILYTEALLEATDQLLKQDPKVIVFGLDVDDPKAIQGTTKGLPKKYGANRVFGTPISEEAMTGAAVGMSLSGLRPIHIHIRNDFMMLAMNQIVNIAAKSRYMHGGTVNIPLVIRSMIGKSWGQGAQHSQSLYSFFMHVPGLKVVAPTTPYDAKGCLIEAVKDNNPVVFIEHRILHFQKGFVPQKMYRVAPGKARVTLKGKDVTLVGISNMQLECIRAHHYLKSVGVEAEIIDPIWLAPLDIDTIVKSVKKTGHLVVVDNDWLNCGASSEIITQVIEHLQGKKEIKVARLGYAPVTCPPTPALENLFYPNAITISQKALELVKGKKTSWTPEPRADLKEIEFKGPF